MSPGLPVSTAPQASFELPTGLSAGAERPLLLLALPVCALLLWALVWRGATGTASERSRRWFFATRLLVVALVVLAAAGPYTVASRETSGDPRVTVLADRSDSTAVSPRVTDRLTNDIKGAGVPVTATTIGSGDASPVGDAVAANLRENGSVVLVSDGRVTEGRSLAEVAELARSLNATVSVVSPQPTDRERYVALNGPSKTSVGVENEFLASVDDVGADAPTTVTVSVDGERVAERTVQNGTGAFEFDHTFDSTGTHRVTARIEGADDVYPQNDVFRKTVRVVEKPTILYVSPGDYPFRQYLSEVYDVETASSVPEDLSPYHAVVLQDVPAEGVGNVAEGTSAGGRASPGNVDALQEFVIDGNGLLVVGGRNSFENGGYEGSSLASMLPVSTGEGASRSTNLVFAIDVSGSAESGMRVQKAVTLSVLDQLGDENRVGIVGFNHNAYAVAPIQSLGSNRASLEDRVRRLQSGGATDIAAGLRGAGEMLGEDPGTVILVSDGHDKVGPPSAVAQRLRARGVRVIAVGAGKNPDEEKLRTIAQSGGGNYFRATETNRLRILFGGSKQYEGSGLTVVDPDSFVTSGVELTANPGEVNDVSVRRGADFLVAADDGTPAVATWRYGLGRVGTITAYGPDGTLDGLLSRPDSLLLTKSTNYVVGDPERKATGVAAISDTRVGSPTTVTVRGEERPTAEGAQFRQVSEGRYEASVTPDEAGYHDVLSATYAANYRAEYAGFGPDPALESLATGTGGKVFRPSEGARIAEFAREQSTRVRPVRQDWTWVALLLAALLFAAEVVYRRVKVRRSGTTAEGGLT
ncbi:VWA domain-containing protein [Halopelagius fulvigenes]|uniref:VWA domain-containing protein n=1 Tax=Halopelagius fulvigenes TaxID=1198324 RepID=A0ABD5U2U9_9EURY